MTFAADVGNDFKTVGQTHLSNLTQSRVRLFRGRGVDLGTDAALLRAVFKSGALGFVVSVLTGLANKLINSGHSVPIR